MKKFLALGAILIIGCDVEVPEYKPVGKVTNLTQITSEKGMDILPDISPDGKEMAFSSNRRGNFDIFIKKPEEQAVIQRTFGRESDLFPSWSPDGHTLAFSSNRFGNFDIFVINSFSGQDTRQITSDKEADEIAPNWSPDGKKLVFTKIRRGNETAYSIVIVDLETGLTTELSDGLFPKFSPDGKKICFQRDIGEGRQSIWTIEVNGTKETEVVYNETFSAIMPVWSPDGEKLVYIATASHLERDAELIDILMGAGVELRTINMNGTCDTQVAIGEGVLSPVWSSDGCIYFSSLRGDNVDIYRTEIGKKEEAKKVEEVVPPHKIVPKPAAEKTKTLFFPKQIEAGITVKVTKDNVNIWSYPGKTVMAKVNKGDALVVIDSSEKWYYQVRLSNGMTGWVCSFFVER